MKNEAKKEVTERRGASELKALLCCECRNWARTDPGIFFTKHHPNCEKYDPVADAQEIIKGLVDGIEEWASDEDGVHPDCWDAYTKGKVSIGEFDFDDSEAT